MAETEHAMFATKTVAKMTPAERADLASTLLALDAIRIRRQRVARQAVVFRLLNRP
jgi:hypothetical protein